MIDKLKKLKFGIAIFLLMFVWFCTPLKYLNPPLEGAGGHSKSIEESKNRNVYCFSYAPTKPAIKLNEGLMLNVKEAWVERGWTYSIFSNKSVIQSNPTLYNLCVRFDNDVDTMLKYFHDSDTRKQVFSFSGTSDSIKVHSIGLGYNTSVFEMGSNQMLALPPKTIKMPIVLLDTSNRSRTPKDTIAWLELIKKETD